MQNIKYQLIFAHYGKLCSCQGIYIQLSKVTGRQKKEIVFTRREVHKYFLNR
jgi:hypothetical protein